MELDNRMVIVGDMGDESEKNKTTESSSHKSLLTEVKRVIASMPTLEIPEVQGKVIQFVFKFVIR